MPVTTLKKDIQLSGLDAWGTVADLGSEDPRRRSQTPSAK